MLSAALLLRAREEAESWSHAGVSWNLSLELKESCLFGPAAQSALNSAPKFMAASAFHPSGKELENAGQYMEMRRAGVITED